MLDETGAWEPPVNNNIETVSPFQRVNRGKYANQLLNAHLKTLWSLFVVKYIYFSKRFYIQVMSLQIN